MISADPPLRSGEAAEEPEIDEAEDTSPEEAKMSSTKTKPKRPTSCPKKPAST